MNDNPSLQTPGEKLASLRMAAGRTLDDMAIATKIPLPMLQALEQDEYHKISGDLYVKSFLRSYAAEVGLEAEEILDLYGSFTGAATGRASGSGPGPAVWQEEEVQIKRLGLPWGTIGIVALLVLILAIVGYFVWPGIDSIGGAEAGSDEDTAVPVPVQEMQPEVEVLRDTVSTTEVHESLLTGSPLENREPPAVTEAEIPVETPKPISSPLPEALVGLPGSLTIDGRTWPVVLSLVFSQAGSVSVKKDGDRQFSEADWPEESRPLPDGEIQSGLCYHVKEGLVVYWGAEDHFSLKVDDPDGVKAAINGQYRDISGLGPGQEIILNDPEVIQSNLPAANRP